MESIHNLAAEAELEQMMMAELQNECSWWDCEDVAQGIIEHIRTDFPDSNPVIYEDRQIAFTHKARFGITYQGREITVAAHMTTLRWGPPKYVEQDQHHYQKFDLADPQSMAALSDFIRENAARAIIV
jgi:hypothetical protein